MDFPNKKSSNAIEAWIKQTKLIDGFLFRGINTATDITHEIQGGQTNRIYKRLAKDSRLPTEIVDHISGHSMRIGTAQELLKSGANIPGIMIRGCWAIAETAMRYLECANNSSTVFPI